MSKPEQTADTPDEKLHDDAAKEESLADQTPVYPVTKLTKRKPPRVLVEPLDDGDRVVLTASEVGALHVTKAALLTLAKYAGDGAEKRASSVGPLFDRILDMYPIKWVDPKPKKPATVVDTESTSG